MSANPAIKTEASLLVIEDEPDLGSLLEHILAREGFEVRLARKGQEALESLGRERPDLVVLDLMLPDMNGLEILRWLRASCGSGTRVIILSAKRDEADRLSGFELGADDYMVKPFSPRELIVRIRKLLDLNTTSEAEPETASLTAGPIEIDLQRHEVRVDKTSIQLTLTEFRLLADMVRNTGRVRTRETLMSEVWGYDSQAMSRTIDTHVRRLRAKLGTASGWIDTVRGIGYRIKRPS